MRGFDLREGAGIGTPDGNDGDEVVGGTVGHSVDGVPEPEPYAWSAGGQIFIAVTLDTGDPVVASYGYDGAGAGAGSYNAVTFGSRCVVGLAGNDDGNYVFLRSLGDLPRAMPAEVGGVATGVTAAPWPATAPAPAWHFTKLAPGRLLAVETGLGGDIVIHSGGNVVIKTTTAGMRTHIDGPVSLGAGPTTPPTGAVAGPGGADVPGVTAVPHVPLPLTPLDYPPKPSPVAPLPPLAGWATSVVTAKTKIYSDPTTDPWLWAYLIAVYSHPAILPLMLAIGMPPPASMWARFGGAPSPDVTAEGGVGS